MKNIITFIERTVNYPEYCLSIRSAATKYAKDEPLSMDERQTLINVANNEFIDGVVSLEVYQDILDHLFSSISGSF